MEENYNENVEVLENEETNMEEVSSGNEFNKGLGLLIAGGLAAVGTITYAVMRRRKKKAAEKPEEEKEPEKTKTKGLKLGHRRLVVIDERSNPEEVPAEE